MFDKNNKNQVLDEHLTNVLDQRTLVDRYIWVRAVVFLVIGALVGGISVLFRPYFDDGVHMEAVAALILLVGMNIGLLKYFIENKRKRYKFAYGLCVCAIWAGYVLGWTIGAGYYWGDVGTMNVMFALVNLVIGYFVFFFHDKLSAES